MLTDTYAGLKSRAEMHPVDMLIEMVIADEMDPWDIDVAEIADRFAEEVRRMERVNLRLSGKTLLTTSILLRMKSEAILPEEEEVPDLGFGMLEDLAGAGGRSRIQGLRVPLRRRAERRSTLFELIDALQQALGEEMIRKNFPKKPRQRPKMVISVDEEDIKERLVRIYEQLKEMGQSYKVINFYDLVPEKQKMVIVEMLLSLLYLDSQKKIKVWQNELFGEIYISLRNGK
ncbi:MAG: segregation/condensation protein A [Euryarchaeota archaeon]|nr:segregation/condensation protein A [Euryarchaeota archaeon]